MNSNLKVHQQPPGPVFDGAELNCGEIVIGCPVSPDKGDLYPKSFLGRAINALFSFLQEDQFFEKVNIKPDFRIIISLNQDRNNEITIEGNGSGIEKPYDLLQYLKDEIQIDTIFGEHLSTFRKICDKITILSKIGIADEYFKLEINLNSKLRTNSDIFRLSWIRTVDIDKMDFSFSEYTKIILSEIHTKYQLTDIEYIRQFIEMKDQPLCASESAVPIIFENRRSVTVNHVKDLNGDMVELNEIDDMQKKSKSLNGDDIQSRRQRKKFIDKKNISKFKVDLSECIKFLDSGNIVHNKNGISQSLLKNS